jgi:LysR family transcriptional regulator, glycine cleavage system transcriptional activator
MVMRRSLPPLNALRAFESAARHGSYVAAATELGVSPAAVSQQIRNLETFLGKTLFMRFNNRVVLTDAGQAVFAGASEAFQSIAALTQQVLTGVTPSRLVISALPSVAGRWLAPQLSQFVRYHPAFRFELRVEDDPVDFSRHGIDLRLCYGTSLYPDLQLTQLRHDATLPVCSPDYLARNPEVHRQGLVAVPDQDLIHTDWGPSFGSHPTWQSWFALSGIGRVAGSGYRVGMSALALDLARDGVGVALGQRMLAEDDLMQGRLVALSDLAIPLGHPYCLVFPHGKARKAGLLEVITWLTEKR